MPLNEARAFRGTRHSLTQQQRTEQLAAVFGLDAHHGARGLDPEPTFFMEPNLANFSPEQIEQMRAMLAAHDANAPREGIKQFDLNNPPKAPYVYREYPRCMYHHKKRLTQNAHSDEQVAAMEKAGWSKEAFLPEGYEAPEAIELDANEAEEIAAVDALAKKKKAKA